jgi:hypothetical protein
MSMTLTNDRQYPDTSVFLLNPRLGVVLQAAPHVAFWLRGGITYYHSTSESPVTTFNPQTGMEVNGPTSTTTTDGTALSIDPEIVFIPFDHVGLTIGPVIDVGLGGSVETEEPQFSGGGTPTNTTVKTSRDFKQSSYGAAAGLLVFF